jgi:hypothetical protein
MRRSALVTIILASLVLLPAGCIQRVNRRFELQVSGATAVIWIDRAYPWPPFRGGIKVDGRIEIDSTRRIAHANLRCFALRIGEMINGQTYYDSFLTGMPPFRARADGAGRIRNSVSWALGPVPVPDLNAPNVTIELLSSRLEAFPCVAFEDEQETAAASSSAGDP